MGPLRRAQRQADVEWLRRSLEHVPLDPPCWLEWWLLPRGPSRAFLGDPAVAWADDHGSDSRDPDSTSSYGGFLGVHAVLLFGDAMPGFPYAAVHELGHALDHGWGGRVAGEWRSLSETVALRGSPLDDYAARNPRERFAQAFTAWWRGSRWPTSPYLHTAEDVRRQEPDLAALFRARFGSGAV